MIGQTKHRVIDHIMEPADSNHAHAASPLHESLLEGPLSSPLHEFLSEDDEDVKPSTPATVRENASKLVIAAAIAAPTDGID